MPPPDVVIAGDDFSKITALQDGERVLSEKVVKCLEAKNIEQDEEYFHLDGKGTVEYFLFPDKLEMNGSEAEALKTIMMNCVEPPKTTNYADRLRAKVEARRAAAAKGGRKTRAKKQPKRKTRKTRKHTSRR